jgi:hypothetical protein|tara:strand:+ start:3817 stop:4776 length:960 start_codon:yes stop_codon:yes gene_type:complete
LINKYLGQAMAEYLVVVTALVSTMFWGANATCPNPNGSLQYTNCIQNLLTTMHDKYEGYSNSMTAVHRYGEPRGDVFVSQWVETSSGGSAPGSGGNIIPVIPAGSPLSRSSQVFSADGSINYGAIEDSSSVPGAVTRDVIVDSEGNIVPPQAVVDCNDRSSVLGFGYQNPSTGKFYDSLTLSEYDTIPPCREPTYRIVDVDGNTTSGVIVGNKYYNSTLSAEVVGDTVIRPRGEVINFLGEPLDCAVLIDPTSFDPMPPLQSGDDFSDDSLRDWYNGINPEAPFGDATANRMGSLDPNENVACPAGSRRVDPPDIIFPF